MRFLALLMAGCIGMLGGDSVTRAAPVPKAKAKTTAEKLQGEWKLVRSPGLDDQAVAIVTFSKDGKLTLKVTLPDGGAWESTGKFTTEGDKISYELQSNNGVRKETLQIRKLTQDELITVDPEDKVEEFKRAK
ncbi:MAG: hypothetical protein LC104_05500 [Bacteroidales bacterium]|nr:hypothetical protein [Bacteroidales bacterium]